MRPPKLSLRTWIVLPTVFVVTGVVLVLSAMEADTLINAWLTSAQGISELASHQVTQVLVSRLESANERAFAQTLEEFKSVWATTIRTDEDIGATLEGSVARGTSIVEISIMDDAGVVLASSNRARPDQIAARVPALKSIRDWKAIDRLRWLFSRSSDTELRVPIGLAGQNQTLFTIQVLVSNVLLRDAVLPGLRRIAVVGLSALLLSWALVYAAARLVEANVKRIGSMIDRIAGGDGAAAPAPAQHQPAATEFAVVESKLTLLGDRVRGALHDAEAYRQRVGTLLERLEEAVLLFDCGRLVLSAGPVERLLQISAASSTGVEVAALFPNETQFGAVLQECWTAGEMVHDRIAERGNRKLLLNLDFIYDSADPNRQLALMRVRDAESAGEVEARLQVSSRLEAINRLTGGVAHEIKNPLNSIAARLGLLETIVESELPEAEKEIRIIAQEIERLDRVVRTFLDFTQPLTLERNRVDMIEVAREVVELMRPGALTKGVDVQLAAQGEQLSVRGDRDLLKQAIMNLAVNGIDAMPQGGKLTIEVWKSDGACHVRVCDTGIGIPENVREKIFQLYFTTKKNGSGIGLAATFRTVQLHGGTIRVESEVGRGSQFDLSLPLFRTEAAVA